TILFGHGLEVSVHLSLVIEARVTLIFCLIEEFFTDKHFVYSITQGRTDHFETRALPEGPGSVGGPMSCP
ncbi:unnamed protein product, partial [Staurois parvus]